MQQHPSDHPWDFCNRLSTNLSSIPTIISPQPILTPESNSYCKKKKKNNNCQIYLSKKKKKERPLPHWHSPEIYVKIDLINKVYIKSSFSFILFFYPISFILSSLNYYNVLCNHLYDSSKSSQISNNRLNFDRMTQKTSEYETLR